MKADYSDSTKLADIKHFSIKVFTLTEILFVIAIIGIIISISIGGYQFVLSKVKDTQTKSMMEQVRIALEAYKNEYGFYPMRPDGGPLVLCRDNPGDEPLTSIDPIFLKYLTELEKWKSSGLLRTEDFRSTDWQRDAGGSPILDANGKPTRQVDCHYRETFIMDPYAKPFWYRSPGYHNRTAYDLESAGPDKMFGYNTLDPEKDENGREWGWHVAGNLDGFDTGFWIIDIEEANNKKHDPSTGYPELQADNIKNWK